MRRSLAYRRTLRFLASFAALCVVVGTSAPTARAITGLTGQDVLPAGGVTETVDGAANDASGTVQTTTADVTTAIVAPAETADTTAPVTADAPETTAAVTSSVEQTTAATAGTVEQAEAPVAEVDDVSATLSGVTPLTADSVANTVDETAGAVTDAVGETTASLTTTVNDVSTTPVEAASELVGTTTPTLLGPVDAMASAIAPEALAPVLASTDSVGGTVSGVLALGEDAVGLLPVTGAVTTTALVTVEPAIRPAAAAARDQQGAVRSAAIGAGPEGPPAASGAAKRTDVRDRPSSVIAPVAARDQERSERATTPAPGAAADFSGMAQPTAGEGSQRASARSAPAGERAAPERYALGSVSSSAGSSGIFSVLLATLAAGLLLAAPGLSRRLRLGLAPWPRPILQLSLERPG